MKIYTKTGDKGKTSLFDGTRVSKAHARVNAYGTVDELNSMIGVVVAHITGSSKQKHMLQKELQKIQNDLLDIGSVLASPYAMPVEGIEKRIASFETVIDQMTDQMPPLTNFILPGGTKTAAFLHVARTIARRAERQIVKLAVGGKLDREVLMYINRLSDVLFTMARYANYLDRQKDLVWVKK